MLLGGPQVGFAGPPQQLLGGYPQVPTSGPYGQQALAMANPQYGQMRATPSLGALSAEPPPSLGGSGGGSSGSGWLGALLGAAQLSGGNLGNLGNSLSGLLGGGGSAAGVSSFMPGSAGTGAAGAASGAGTLGSDAALVDALYGGAGATGAGAGISAGTVGLAAPAGSAGAGAAAAATGAGAAGGGGAAAGGAGAGAGMGTALGIAGLAALPIALGMAGVYGDPLQDQQSQLKRAYQGLGLTPIRTTGGQDLIMLPDGGFIDARGITNTLDDRFGKESQESLMNWLNSRARVDYRIPHLARPRGRRPEDYR
jgi:hypothetical protein